MQKLTFRGVSMQAKKLYGFAAKVDAHHGADSTENPLLNGGDKVLCRPGPILESYVSHVILRFSDHCS